MLRAFTVALLFVATGISAAPLRAWGVQHIPLLFPPGIASWLNWNDVPQGGPLGTYLDTLLQGCNYSDSFTITNWSETGRNAEFSVVSLPNIDFAFPVPRQWQLSRVTFGPTSGGMVFIPVLSSPGTCLFTTRI